MSILIYRANFTMTTSSGTATDTLKTDNKILYQVFVNPANPTTTYDFKLTDELSNDIYESTDNTGLLNEQVQLLIYGNLTLTISGSNRDEAFKVLLPNRGR